MKQISSRDNPLFKSLQRLLAASGKRGSQVMLDGVHLCQAWLQRHGAPAQALFDAERLDHPEIRALIAQLPAERCIVLDARLMHGLISVESGQGALFVVEPPVPELPARINENCVLLDGIQDPGNVGTLLRTCAAAGVQRVLLGHGSAGAWSAKVLRSGQGAHFALAIHEHLALVDMLERLQVPLLATALDGARSLYAGRLPAQCAWVFGHEGRGVSQALLEAASLRVFVPHEAAAVESLNVGAAAAICLFEQRRQVLYGQS